MGKEREWAEPIRDRVYRVAMKQRQDFFWQGLGLACRTPRQRRS